MARPLRVEYPGAYYHAINRGNNQEKMGKEPGHILNIKYFQPIFNI